jgi:acyl-coenzyme A thioesterase 13
MSSSPSAQMIEEGEFKGWFLSPFKDNYVNLIGPFYYKPLEDGSTQTAFKVDERHLNGGGNMHGGCLLSLADTALFVIALEALGDGRGVTLGLEAQFLNPARPGDLLIATGEITKAGASVIFVRGQIKSEARIVVTFTGVIKRTKPKIA